MMEMSMYRGLLKSIVVVDIGDRYSAGVKRTKRHLCIDIKGFLGNTRWKREMNLFFTQKEGTNRTCNCIFLQIYNNFLEKLQTFLNLPGCGKDSIYYGISFISCGE